MVYYIHLVQKANTGKGVSWSAQLLEVHPSAAGRRAATQRLNNKSEKTRALYSGCSTTALNSGALIARDSSAWPFSARQSQHNPQKASVENIQPPLG